MNADEAGKCLNIAKRAINIGDFEKAEKFLIKSIKLHETNEAQGLLQRLDSIRASRASSANSSRAASPPAPRRAPPPPPEPKKFTPEQQKLAKEVLKCNDYYAILGVSRDVNENDLKRAYKKKCLRLHPDKNGAPEADEAFKKVNAAMTCLADPTKRRQYN